LTFPTSAPPQEDFDGRWCFFVERAVQSPFRSVGFVKPPGLIAINFEERVIVREFVEQSFVLGRDSALGIRHRAEEHDRDKNSVQFHFSVPSGECAERLS
jgi:hypothetical protein